MNPRNPVANPRSMVRGMTGRMRTLAGRARIERFPILYRMNGRTKIYAEKVTETISRSPSFGVTHMKYFSIWGDMNMTATVAMKESWKDTSNARIIGLIATMMTAARTRARETLYVLPS